MRYHKTYAILSQTTVKIPVTLKYFFLAGEVTWYEMPTPISFHKPSFLLKSLLCIQTLP